MRQAQSDLAAFAGDGLRRSSLWRTAPVDCPPDAPAFINAAVAFNPGTDMTPETLLFALKRLERQAGRVSGPRHAPRCLDLDLVLFGDECRRLPWFHLPHPRALQRRFVLAPAAEVLPDVVWPGLGTTIAELLASLDVPTQRGDDEWAERLDVESLA